jgi:dihydrolipoamide dehydrogenase
MLRLILNILVNIFHDFYEFHIYPGGRAMQIAILGAGPGGYVAAIRAAQLGAGVTLVEKGPLGGTCLNWGCIPSKVFRQTAATLTAFRSADDVAIVADAGARCDMPALVARKERIVGIQAGGIAALLKKNGVRVITGKGRISAPHRLVVTAADGGEQEIAWDKLILATGSRPANIPAFPFDGRQILSSDHVFSLDRIPESLAIVGGGVIGCEMASIFAALGSRVALIEAMDRLLPLPSVDEECSKLLAREMKKQKIRVLTGTTVHSAALSGGRVELRIGRVGTTDTADLQQESCEKLLVCIGRTPNSADIGLAAIGVEVDARGWVVADSRLRTSNPDVYAIGDILGPSRVMLAHVASTEGEIAAANCLGGNLEMEYDCVPGAIFTMPEIASVGLSEAEATAKGMRVKADSVLFRTLGKAQILGEIAGFAKIIADQDSGRILGVHIAGPHATDLIAEGVLAMRGGMTVDQLADTIHAHPTLAEIMLETAFKVLGRPLHG